MRVVVDNRVGAGGRVGTEAAAKAPADGCTLIMGNAGSNGINAALYRDVPFDLERDFVPVTQVMRAPNVLVINASLPVGNTPEAFAAIVRTDIAKWKDVAKNASIRAD